MRKTLLLTLFICTALWAVCQDDAADKSGLLLYHCGYEPNAEVMILKDKGEVSINSDFSVRLDRQLTIKFFREQKLDKVISDIVFYPTPVWTAYSKMTVTAIDLDQTTKGLLPRDVTGRVTSTHLDLSGIRAKKGSILKVSYTVTLPYDQKLPAWRFQSIYPTDYSELRVVTPDVVNLKTTLVGTVRPDINNSTDATKQLTFDDRIQPVGVNTSTYIYNQLPSVRLESFCDNISNQMQRLEMVMFSVGRGVDLRTNFASKQVDHIVESFSLKQDYIMRLQADLDIKSDYDRRIRSITSDEEKLARIYDLVRRRITFDGEDTLSAKPLSKVWADKKGNSTEINLTLVKLLLVYGYDASPMLVSTRANGRVDTNAVSVNDFNRTVAHVRFDNRVVILDATARYFDYPLISSSILNTTGLLLSMDRHRWVPIVDNKNYYKNSVILLGHLLGDSLFHTNVYVNSTGYAKAEHVDIYERDSLKGIKNYFERGNKSLRLKHFIVANEYVDTLALAQEFDIRTEPIKTDNLYGIIPTTFALPDTLLTIGEGRKSSVDFGYRQQYDLVSEYSFPERYEIYLMPNNLQMSAVNGAVHYEREYHNSTTSFSLKQSLVIEKSYFNLVDAIELGKFLRKIDNLNKQQVVLKKLN